MLHETTWAKFVFWRCEFLKLVKKLATQKLRRKSLKQSPRMVPCNITLR